MDKWQTITDMEVNQGKQNIYFSYLYFLIIHINTCIYT